MSRFDVSATRTVSDAEAARRLAQAYRIILEAAQRKTADVSRVSEAGDTSAAGDGQPKQVNRRCNKSTGATGAQVR